MEYIISLDTQLFYFINKTLSCGFTDAIMPLVTSMTFWLPFLVVFGIYQVWKGGTNGRLCVIALVLGVLMCDQISSNLIKEIVGRPRPCHQLSDIHLLVGCGAGKSFPSSHAANAMMAVTVIALFFQKHRYWLPWLAVLIGISRIFVGVHFPLDVLCGWAIGTILGYCSYKIVNKLYAVYKKRKEVEGKIS